MIKLNDYLDMIIQPKCDDRVKVYGYPLWLKVSAYPYYFMFRLFYPFLVREIAKTLVMEIDNGQKNTRLP